MKTYPIMLDVRGKLAVVVGGGRVGMRKVRSLRDAGARVRLITSEATDESDLAEVELLLENYRAEALVGAALVFACTDDHELNTQISRDARQIGAIVNAVDQPEDCDFYVPAVVGDGDVIVAVGTGGCSPALAGKLKSIVGAALPERVGEYAAALGRMRDKVKAAVDDVDRRGVILKSLTSDEAMRAFFDDGSDALEAMADTLIRQEGDAE
jgi:precorrin-2 dehydrogenase / sirohydrochlorin ferrochelatase